VVIVLLPLGHYNEKLLFGHFKQTVQGETDTSPTSIISAITVISPHEIFTSLVDVKSSNFLLHGAMSDNDKVLLHVFLICHHRHPRPAHLSSSVSTHDSDTFFEKLCGCEWVNLLPSLVRLPAGE
jgi:hypothetical protein